MTREEIDRLRAQIIELKCKTAKEVEEARIRFLGKKGELTRLFDEFRLVDKEQKKEFGKVLNELKQAATAKIEELKEMAQDAAASLAPKQDLRLVEGAVDVIYKTMAECRLEHDEGPDVGGPVAPYVQTERRPLYREYAELLMEQGTFNDHINILGGHIDSPRIDLKPTPLYEDNGFAMFKTHYYGGIKKYQWLALPLALHGVIAKKDGRSIKVVIGEDPSDPVLGITDLLPHFDKDMRTKPIGTAFTGEDLNVSVGTIPYVAEDEEEAKEISEAVRKNILNILKDKYDFDEEDFLSSEFEIVPAGPARDYGIDRSMIMAYGHDDRICSYTSAMAQLAFADTITERTLVSLLVDKEEIGSVGATGMQSRFFENAIAEIMNLAGEYSELNMRRILSTAKMLSSDVTNGFDPNYASIHDRTNAPYFAFGPTLHKYTGGGGKGGSNDAAPEFIAEIRKIYDDNEIRFQLAELGKVDGGGGGTIAYIMGNYNMDVIDLGIPVHSMHAPWETASKVDIYEAYRAYKAFLEFI